MDILLRDASADLTYVPVLGGRTIAPTAPLPLYCTVVPPICMLILWRIEPASGHVSYRTRKPFRFITSLRSPSTQYLSYSCGETNQKSHSHRCIGGRGEEHPLPSALLAPNVTETSKNILTTEVTGKPYIQATHRILSTTSLPYCHK